MAKVWLWRWLAIAALVGCVGFVMAIWGAHSKTATQGPYFLPSAM